MILWLYEKKWILIIASLLFGLLFSLEIHTSIQDGKNHPTDSKMHMLLSYWWIALISIYLLFLAETLHGMLKNKSFISKAITMAFPTIFMLMSIHTTIKLIK